MQKNTGAYKKALRPCWPIKGKNSWRGQWLLIACYLLGCNATDNIEGVYTAEWSNAYYSTRDTIQVRAVGGTDNYQLSRRSLATGQGQPRYQLQQWTAIYHRETNTLRINSNGRLLLFRHGQLIMGSTVYKKI